MTEKYFIDSNIWLYTLLGDDDDKYLIAKKFINEKIDNKEVVISWQVLNEITNNLIKRKFPERHIIVIIEYIISVVNSFVKITKN